MSSEDILSQAPPPADARIFYGSDPLQFFDLRLPNRNLESTIPRNSPEAISSMRVGQGFSPDLRATRTKKGFAVPLALMVHGGFWRAKYDVTHAGHLCAALTRAGIATANIEYRRVGNPGGGWPGSLQDVEAALQFISSTAKDHSFDLDRVAVIGHSAGGQLALAVASRHPQICGVVALAPVSDLRGAFDLHLSNDAVVEFLGGTPAQIPKHYVEASPLELAIFVPQVIIHGRGDETVPLEMSRSYAKVKQALAENVRLLELECGHFEPIDPSSFAWSTVEHAVVELLKP